MPYGSCGWGINCGGLGEDTLFTLRWLICEASAGSAWGRTQITGVAMVHLVGIRKLHIAGCPHLTDAALAPLTDGGASIFRVFVSEL